MAGQANTFGLGRAAEPTLQDYGYFVSTQQQQAESQNRSHQLEAVLTASLMLLKDIENNTTQDKVRPVQIVYPTASEKSGIIALLPYTLKSRNALILTPSQEISRELAKTFGICRAADKHSFPLKDIYNETKILDLINNLWPVPIIDKDPNIPKQLTNLVIYSAQEFDVRSDSLCLLYQNKVIEPDVHPVFSQFDLLIVNEAHDFSLETLEILINMFHLSGETSEKKIVFLTATLTLKVLNERIAFSITTPTPTLKEINEQNAFSITTPNSPTPLRRHKRKANFVEMDDLETIPGDIQYFLKKQQLEEPRFPPQAMIIVKNRNKALVCETILNAALGPSFAIAIFNGREISDKILTKDFNAGLYRVAIICAKRKEGYFDNPKVTLCVILRKIGSQSMFSWFIRKCQEINRTIEGTEQDRTIAIVLSYAKFQQRKMWKQQELMDEREPTEVDEDSKPTDEETFAEDDYCMDFEEA